MAKAPVDPGAFVIYRVAPPSYERGNKLTVKQNLPSTGLYHFSPLGSRKSEDLTPSYPVTRHSRKLTLTRVSPIQALPF